MSVTGFHKGKILWVFLLCIALSACTGNPALPPTAALEITTLVRTLTPAPEIAYTPTDTPRPSRTPTVPQSTGTQWWYKSWTTNQAAISNRHAIETDHVNATYGPTLTILAQFPGICEESWRQTFSPDGNWLAMVCNKSYGAYETLEVVNRNGTRWVVYFKDYLADGGEAGLPIGGLYPRYWSQDGKYLYFTPKIEYDGGGICHYRFGVQGLFRLTLEDGTVSATLPIVDGDGWYHISFSPTGRRIAFTDYFYDRPITILDLNIGERTIVDDEDRPTGIFAWSPDGLNLAYTICQSSEDHESIARSAVKVYSVQSGIVTTILQVENFFLSIKGWDKNNILEIGYHELWYDSYPVEARYYNWSSGQFVTPTPTP